MSIQIGLGTQIGPNVQIGTYSQKSSIIDNKGVEMSEENKKTKLDEVDRLVLELAKSQRQVSLADAKTALANNEKSELQYKYVVLQIYMKYNLTENDSITESGDINYGGAITQQENKA